MSELRALIQQIPTEQIAQQLGASPEETQQAINTLVPTLMAGLQANAQDPAGEASLQQALADHDPSLVEGGVDLNQVDTEDGAKIAHHIFGQQQDKVVDRLAVAGGGSSSLLQKLLPILAPIVLSFVVSQLTKRMGGQAGSPQAGGGLGDILGSILGGGQAQTSAPQQGGGLGDILGSILGGGPQAQTSAPQNSAPQQGGGLGDILGSILGGGQQAGSAANAGGGMPAPANTEPMSGGLRGPQDAQQQAPQDAQQQQAPQGGGIGDVLGGVLGDLLGGGRR